MSGTHSASGGIQVGAQIGEQGCGWPPACPWGGEPPRPQVSCQQEGAQRSRGPHPGVTRQPLQIALHTEDVARALALLCYKIIRTQPAS